MPRKQRACFYTCKIAAAAQSVPRASSFLQETSVLPQLVNSISASALRSSHVDCLAAQDEQVIYCLGYSTTKTTRKGPCSRIGRGRRRQCTPVRAHNMASRLKLGSVSFALPCRKALIFKLTLARDARTVSPGSAQQQVVHIDS